MPPWFIKCWMEPLGLGNIGKEWPCQQSQTCKNIWCLKSYDIVTNKMFFPINKVVMNAIEWSKQTERSDMEIFYTITNITMTVDCMIASSEADNCLKIVHFSLSYYVLAYFSPNWLKLVWIIVEIVFLSYYSCYQVK